MCFLTRAATEMHNSDVLIWQDVIERGSKVHPLYARVVEAEAPHTIVIPAQPQKGVQV